MIDLDEFNYEDLIIITHLFWFFKFSLKLLSKLFIFKKFNLFFFSNVRRRNIPKMKSWTRPNLSGPVIQTIFLKRNMVNSTSHWLTTGKNTWPSNISVLKANWNSEPYFSSPKGLLLICLKTRSKRTISNYMSEGFSSWTTARSSSLST